LRDTTNEIHLFFDEIRMRFIYSLMRLFCCSYDFSFQSLKTWKSLSKTNASSLFKDNFSIVQSFVFYLEDGFN